MASLGEVQWLFWGKYNGPSGGTTMAPVGKSQKPHFASKWFPDRLPDVFETSPNNPHFPNMSEIKIKCIDKLVYIQFAIHISDGVH